MTWREAYDALKAALEAEATIVANSIPVLDGIHADMTPTELAETHEGIFTDNPFTVVIEHPAASTADQSRSMLFLRNAFSVFIVENPKQRESTALDPLEVPFAIATGVFGGRTGHGRLGFEANRDFYVYAGNPRGFLFHRFTFLTSTELPAAGLPSAPSPVAIS